MKRNWVLGTLFIASFIGCLWIIKHKSVTSIAPVDLPTKTSVQSMVIAVIDGDTIRVNDGTKKTMSVRLFGIDAPELKQRDGAVAGRYLASRIGGEPVFIDALSTDQYGRTVAMVYDRNGQNINEAMIQTGMAWVYRRYTDNANWLALEATARQNRWGIWRRDTVIEPWVFRARSIHR